MRARVCRRLAFCVSFFWIGGFVQTQSLLAQSFTVEQVMSAPFPSDLTAAAHGSAVAWVSNSRGERNVWIAEGPEFTPRQVTLQPDGGPGAAAAGGPLPGMGNG